MPRIQNLLTIPNMSVIRDLPGILNLPLIHDLPWIHMGIHNLPWIQNLPDIHNLPGIPNLPGSGSLSCSVLASRQDVLCHRDAPWSHYDDGARAGADVGYPAHFALSGGPGQDPGGSLFPHSSGGAAGRPGVGSVVGFGAVCDA
eukprot:1384472-Amorphochlora_amoeboformis.AAC.1